MRHKILLTLFVFTALACNRRIVKPPMQPSFSYEALGNFTIDPNAGSTEKFTAQGFEIIPFRSLVVNPHKILPGTILFIPAVYGQILPGGELHDGFFLADETDTTLSKNALRIFTKVTNEKKSKILPKRGKRVAVYRVSQPIRSAVLQKYKYRKKNPGLNPLLI